MLKFLFKPEDIGRKENIYKFSFFVNPGCRSCLLRHTLWYIPETGSGDPPPLTSILGESDRVILKNRIDRGPFYSHYSNKQFFFQNLWGANGTKIMLRGGGSCPCCPSPICVPAPLYSYDTFAGFLSSLFYFPPSLWLENHELKPRI